MNTSEFLTITAAIVPDRVAILDPDKRYTYGELHARAQRLANAFTAIGVGKGHNVGVMAVNSTEFVELYYASAIVGATFVPLNYRAKEEELTYMVNTAEIKVLFISDRYQGLLAKIGPGLTSVEHLVALETASGDQKHYDEVLASGSDDFVYTEVDDESCVEPVLAAGTRLAGY